MKYRTSQRTSTPGSTSRTTCNSFVKTPRSQRTFRPGGKPLSPVCQRSPLTFHGITSSGLRAARVMLLLKASTAWRRNWRKAGVSISLS